MSQSQKEVRQQRIARALKTKQWRSSSPPPPPAASNSSSNPSSNQIATKSATATSEAANMSNISFFGELSPKGQHLASPRSPLGDGNDELFPKMTYDTDYTAAPTVKTTYSAAITTAPTNEHEHYQQQLNLPDPRSPARSTGTKNSRRSNATAESSISVIIGKTFEATTLPDGSQQIIEATKYKRLSDGYVYQETKMRSLDDDDDDARDEVNNVGSGEQGDVRRIPLESGIIEAYNEISPLGGMPSDMPVVDTNQVHMGIPPHETPITRNARGSRLSDVAVFSPPAAGRNADAIVPPSSTINSGRALNRRSLDRNRSDAAVFTPPPQQAWEGEFGAQRDEVEGIDNQHHQHHWEHHQSDQTQGQDFPTPSDPHVGQYQGSFVSTFSTSESFSPTASRTESDNATNFVSCVTEDHDAMYSTTPGGTTQGSTPGKHKEGFVQEYLYDDDPVGLQQWKDQSQPLSPSNPQARENVGWCPGWESGNGGGGGDTPNSLQLNKDAISSRVSNVLWSPRSKRAVATVRNFFPSTPMNSGNEDKVKTLAVQTNGGFGKKGRSNSSEEDDDEEAGIGRCTPNLACNERIKTRRCKMLIFAMLCVAIGAIIAAPILLFIPSKESIDENAMEYVEPEEEVIVLPLAPSDMDGNNTSTVNNDEETTAADVANSENTEDVPVVVVPVQETKPVQNPCIHLEIVMSIPTTNSSNIGNAEDTNAWSLTRVNKYGKKNTVKSSDTLPESSEANGNVTTHTFKRCVQPGVFTLAISDSGGDGLGSDGKGGYYITANDVTLGVSSFFFHEERMTFTLPFDAEETEYASRDGVADSPGEVDTVCTDDFFLAIKTDDNPSQTKWNVIDNDTGNQVLTGGPYELPYAVYTRRACLPDGSYTFTMTDDGGDGVCCNDGQGFFVLYKDGEPIVNSDGEFGNRTSSVFTLGDGDQR